MTTIAATFSRHLRIPGTAYRSYSWTSYIKRFRYFIEHSDWNERIIAHEERANRICVGIIIASALILLPALIKIFLR